MYLGKQLKFRHFRKDVSLEVNSSHEDVQEIILNLNETWKQVLRQIELEQTKKKRIKFQTEDI